MPRSGIPLNELVGATGARLVIDHLVESKNHLVAANRAKPERRVRLLEQLSEGGVTTLIHPRRADAKAAASVMATVVPFLFRVYRGFPCGLTLKLSRIAARSQAHDKLFLPFGWRSDAISA